MGPGRVLHFAAGARRFGFRISDISEIREVAALTIVPGAPDTIAGLTDIRGRIVTLVDLSSFFGPAPTDGEGRLAAQFAEPLAHLAVLIPGGVHNLRTDLEEESDPQTGALARSPADEASSQSPPGSRSPGAELSPASEPAAGAAQPGSLGREIVLSGGRPVFLLDIEAIAAQCAARVRDRFRVAR